MSYFSKPVKLLLFCNILLLTFGACTPDKATRQENETELQVFTPAANEAPENEDLNSKYHDPETAAKPPPASKEIAKPDLKNLHKISPNQEAKRALTNDAFKATKMELSEFGAFMQSRIPYYRNKGDLKFENDIVRIQITSEEMVIQTMKGRLTYPMH